MSPIARHIDIELRQRNEEIEKLEKLINHVIAYRKRVRAIIRNLENVNVRKKNGKKLYEWTPPQDTIASISEVPKGYEKSKNN